MNYQQNKKLDKYNPISKERNKQLFWFFILPKRMNLDEILDWTFTIDIVFWLIVFFQSQVFTINLHSKNQDLALFVCVVLCIFGFIQSIYSQIMKIYVVKELKSRTINVLMNLWIVFRTIGATLFLLVILTLYALMTAYFFREFSSNQKILDYIKETQNNKESVQRILEPNYERGEGTIQQHITNLGILSFILMFLTYCAIYMFVIGFSAYNAFKKQKKMDKISYTTVNVEYNI